MSSSSSRHRSSAAPAADGPAAVPPLDPSFRALADGIADLVLRFDLEHRLLHANRAYELLSGRCLDALRGRDLCDLGLDAESVALLRGAIDRVLDGAREVDVRHRCTPADGVARWFESRFIPEADAGGTPCAVICVSRDVTPELAAEEARRIRETQFELLYSAAPVGIGRTTLDGRWLDANPRLCAMLGYTLDELRGMTSADVTMPGEAVVTGAALLANGDGHQQMVKRFRRRDGSALWVAVSVRVAHDADGRPLHIVGIAEDVGERLAAERALRESEARFRALVEQSPLSTVVLDREGHVVEANPAFERLWGITLAQVPAGYSVLTDAQTVANGARDAFERALAGEYVTLPPAHYADRRVGDPAMRRWVQNVYYPIIDADGAVSGVVCIQEDVTARREAETALRESEGRLRAVFEHVPIGIAVADAAHGFITNANAALCRILDYSAEELAHMHFREFTHPDDLAEDERLMAEVEMGLRDHYGMEKRLVRRDGSLRWAHLTIATVRGADGRPRYMVGMTMDITERKLIEAELRRRERELASLTDNSPDVVTRYGPDLRVRFMSAAFERATGVPAAQAIGRRIPELGFDPAISEPIEAATRRVFDTGLDAEVEFDFVAPDGALLTWSAQVVPERDERGRIESALSVTRDVTERTRTRRALLESEERFRALVEHSSDLIAILEPDGRVRYASPAQSRLLGYMPADFPALVAYDMVHPDDVALARRRLGGAASAGGDASSERPLRIRRRDGTYRSFLVRLSDMRDDAAVRGIVVNARDVTEELRLQERLAQAQKMEALGQLAGGVAHDFNNILAAIASYGQLLVDELPPGGTPSADAAEIVRAAARGAAVTGQLLAFSRRQALETEVIDLGALVRDTARMLRPLLPSSITLELPAADAPATHVRATRAQVEQIVVNLAVNARDAMADGGVLEVRVGTRVRHDGVDAVLVVADSGVGMSAAVRARAFEPFFTTKPAGRGTGLGLATVYGLVRQFGGTIEVDSVEGAGTTFTVALPLAEPAPPPAAAPEGRPPRAAGGARILLAEDEEQVRTSLARALGRAGHAVVAVPDGQAALDLLRAGERVDVVLSDVAMPRLGGRDLAAAVARDFPGLRVVLMSGYAEIAGEPAAGDVAGFVAKPFDVARLLQLVDDVLHAGDD